MHELTTANPDVTRTLVQDHQRRRQAEAARRPAPFAPMPSDFAEKAMLAFHRAVGAATFGRLRPRPAPPVDYPTASTRSLA